MPRCSSTQARPAGDLSTTTLTRLHRRPRRRGRRPRAAQLRHDVAVDAANLVAAFIDVDDRQTDAELWAYTGAFAGELDVSPGRRHAGRRAQLAVIVGRRHWLDEPSVLFDLLAKADSRHGTALATRYYARALRLAHTVAALDLVPSRVGAGRHRSLPLAPAAHARRLRRASPGRAAPAAAPCAGVDRAGGACRGRADRSGRHRYAPAAARARAPARPSSRRGAGRPRRPDRPGRGEGRGAPAHRPPADQPAASRTRPADHRDQPAPRLHRQSRYRQDHRRPPHRRDLPQPGRRRAGPPRRDRPFRSGRRLRRPDRDQDEGGRRAGRSAACC